MLAIPFWYIWKARNTARNGEIENHPSYWVEKLCLMLICFYCMESDLYIPTGESSLGQSFGLHHRRAGS
jgi:hypothetical protein